MQKPIFSVFLSDTVVLVLVVVVVSSSISSTSSIIYHSQAANITAIDTTYS